MKKRILGLLLGLVFALNLSAKNDVITTTQALIERVTPGYSKQVRLEVIPKVDGKDVYEIDRSGRQVCLRGNSPVSLSLAYHNYLKSYCRVHLSWFGDQLKLPARLPLPSESERVVIDARWRVYMNYCTVSYSAAWWNWQRWEREIDFMALNGVNMPLATVGLEAVWYATLQRFGFSDLEARTFLAAPAHSAWQWMQNLQSYNGPLPLSWIESHREMGRQIINRQLELGMQPIQQGFSGFVPSELAAKRPQAAIRTQKRWCAFPGAAQLDPTDPLFKEFGTVFLEEQKKLFGAHGYYAADPFHESAPPVDTPEYLGSVGEAIYDLFKAFDSRSIWVMQAWSLREPIVKAVPHDDLLILDLNGSKCRSKEFFWGYPFVAGYLHNFGGRINLHGDLSLLAGNRNEKLKTIAPNLVGTGLFMEGINQNPVFYDLAFEMMTRSGEVDLSEWLPIYAERRYGSISKSAGKAWLLLLKGPYREKTNGTEFSSIVAARPALIPKKSGPNAGFTIPYDPRLLFEAQALLLHDQKRMQTSVPYRFDVVDVQRQILSNLGQAMHLAAIKSYQDGDMQGFRLHANRFLTMLEELDELLSTRPEYSFQQWLEEARRWGKDQEEVALFDKDATSLVTIWGPDEPIIFDYSWREWSGLVSGYYRPRWVMFYDYIEEYYRQTGKLYTEEGLKLVHGREAFRANDFYNRLADWEKTFVLDSDKRLTPTRYGQELKTVNRLFAKYSRLATEYYTETTQGERINAKEKRFENLGE